MLSVCRATAKHTGPTLKPRPQGPATTTRWWQAAMSSKNSCVVLSLCRECSREQCFQSEEQSGVAEKRSPARPDTSVRGSSTLSNDRPPPAAKTRCEPAPQPLHDADLLSIFELRPQTRSPENQAHWRCKLHPQVEVGLTRPATWASHKQSTSYRLKKV